ncbi:MAG: hypothetical protein ACW97Z_10320 [Candidatus Hodarchaeales archaeon]
MTENLLFNILRGILVAIVSSMIIGFMVIILGPIIPFIPFDGIFPLAILFVIFCLTLVTYFSLPPEVNEKEEEITISETLSESL